MKRVLRDVKVYRTRAADAAATALMFRFRALLCRSTCPGAPACVCDGAPLRESIRKVLPDSLAAVYAEVVNGVGHGADVDMTSVKNVAAAAASGNGAGSGAGAPRNDNGGGRSVGGRRGRGATSVRHVSKTGSMPPPV
jgi:hypothetical protein